MKDIDLVLDTAQAMDAIGRPVRAEELRALATRLSRAMRVKPEKTVAELKIIDDLPDGVIMLVGDNTVRFVQESS